MKERDYTLDVIRVTATFFIVLFHFASANLLANSPFYTYANGAWGGPLNSIFFVLSGFVLEKKYDKIDNVKAFYKQRFLAIFPVFYIAFLVCYLLTAIASGNFFYGGNPVKLLLTVIGADNYSLLYGGTGYAVVGEWFTAIIVLIYIVFPVLCKMFKTMTVSATLIIALLYILNLFWGLTSTSVETSFINGLFLFWVGMLLTKVSKYLKRNILVTAITFILSAAIIFYRVNVVEAVRLAMMNLLGITLFVFLYGLFGFEWKSEKARKTLMFFSNISYSVYISHHFIVNKVAGKMMENNININIYLYFIVLWMVIFAVSIVLYQVSRYVIKLPGKIKKSKSKGEK